MYIHIYIYTYVCLYIYTNIRNKIPYKDKDQYRKNAISPVTRTIG